MEDEMAADTQQLQGEVNDSPSDHAASIPVEMMLKGFLAALVEEERREVIKRQGILMTPVAGVTTLQAAQNRADSESLEASS